VLRSAFRARTTWRREPHPALIPVLIAAAMLAASSITSTLGGPSPIRLFPEYVGKAFSLEVVAVLCFVFIRVAGLARIRAERPLTMVWSELRPRLPLLVLPVLIFPIFLAAFTAVKSAIPRLVGFHFDRLLADADTLLLGQDAWRFTHAVIGPAATQVIQYLYVWGWIAVVGYTRALVPLFASRRFTAVFFAASLMTWFLAGFVGAYLLTAAGPIFAHLADPSLVPRFMPLKTHLAAMLPPGSPFLNGPLYLEEGIRTGQAFSGGGISAMPSMHVATVTLLVMASRQTRFLVPACIFAGVIFVGSIHSGYHYAMDAVVAAGITILCWRVAEGIFPARDSSTWKRGESLALSRARERNAQTLRR